jgi:hypothetical protein
MDFHLNTAFQKLQELLGDIGDVVDLDVVEHRRVRRLLHGFCGKYFAEEFVFHERQVAEHGKIRRAFDFQFVGPGLAQEVLLGLDVSEGLA